MDVSDSSRRLVVGLGNPGSQYAATRHNVGFQVLDRLGRRFGVGGFRDYCGALVAEAGAVLLAKPQTYMNRSGFAVRCLLDHHGLSPDRILVIYDEIHLPLGELRLRGKGSAAGHRGMESILESVGASEIPRLRLGVGGVSVPGGGESLVDYVLAPFDAAELDPVAEMIQRAADAAVSWNEVGLEKAMGLFNGTGAKVGEPKSP